MTHLYHIVDRVTPDDSLQVGLELPNRRTSQHTLGVLLALWTLGFQAQVGQAGIGGVDQVQVPNHSPVVPTENSIRGRNIAFACSRMRTSGSTGARCCGVAWHFSVNLTESAGSVHAVCRD